MYMYVQTKLSPFEGANDLLLFVKIHVLLHN